MINSDNKLIEQLRLAMSTAIAQSDEVASIHAEMIERGYTVKNMTMELTLVESTVLQSKIKLKSDNWLERLFDLEDHRG